jgi:hypothetical protein
VRKRKNDKDNDNETVPKKLNKRQVQVSPGSHCTLTSSSTAQVTKQWSLI